MDPGESRLSPREAEIVELVAQGQQTREIAILLSLSPNTVKTHLKDIFRKCRVRNRTELAGWWRGTEKGR
jgi:two-component system nitrate/nitrite response regulator NarL